MDKNEIIKDNDTNNKIISSTIEKSSIIIKLVYEFKDEEYIKLFGSNFFKQNKRKIKIIINNKLCNLTKNYINISNNKMKILKIKLLILNSPEINLSKMFYNCSSLKNFCLVTKYELKLKNKLIEKEKDTQIDSLDKNNSEEINKQSSVNLYLFNKSSNKSEIIYENDSMFDFSDYKTKSQFIFNYSSKNAISEDKKKQINQTVFQSHNFLLPFLSFDSILFRFNNNGYKLININLFSSPNINYKLIKKNNKDIETNNLLENIYYNLLYLDNYCDINNNIITDLSCMFYGCSLLKSISGLSKLNIINVQNMSHIFDKCSNLENISNITYWKTNNVIDMNCMFANCSSLVSLPDISNWNTSNTRDMNGLFFNCSSLKKLSDISKWKIDNVNNLSGLFCNCSSLKSLPDISKFT